MNIIIPDITGKDKEILRAILDPVFEVGSITSKTLQKKLIGTNWASEMTDKKLSARISRQHSLSYGIIRKLQKNISS